MKIVKESIKNLTNKITIELDIMFEPNTSGDPEERDFASFLRKNKISFLKNPKIGRSGDEYGFFTGSLPSIINLMKVYYAYDDKDIIEIFENTK